MLKNKSILLIDDEEDVLDLLKLILETEGYDVTITSNCKDALDTVKEKEFFMVISDIAMPEMDGYEILTEITKIRSNIRFAVMTGFGYNPNHTLVKIREESECPCFFKPFNRKKVIGKVKEAFQKYNGLAVES